MTNAIQNIGQYAQVTRYQPTNNDRITNAERQIARIDREINAREQYVDALITSRDAHIASRDAHIESRNLHIEARQLLQESKALDQKKIGIIDKRIASGEELIAAAEELLARRTRSASPALETIAKDAVKISSNIQEASAKVAEVKEAAKSSGKELARSERIAVASNTLEQVAKNKTATESSTQTSITYSSLVPKNRAVKLEGLNIQPYANDSANARKESMLRDIVYSQKNLYESIINAKMNKLL